jgi:hypothetical protein
MNTQVALKRRLWNSILWDKIYGRNNRKNDRKVLSTISLTQSSQMIKGNAIIFLTGADWRGNTPLRLVVALGDRSVMALGGLRWKI